MRHLVHKLATGQADNFGERNLQVVLGLLSWVFAFGIWVRNLCYRINICQPKKLPVPVISVGNVTWGGVGKTPFVLWLAEHYRQRGKTPAVLMRGYTAGPSGRGDGDEAMMLRQHLPDLPVIVGKRRGEEAEKFLQQSRPDFFILDDGFQHRQLARDLDICLIDCSNPFGNGHLIPRGILRENLSALHRADVICLTKTELAPENIAIIHDRLKSLGIIKPFVLSRQVATHLTNVRTEAREDIAVLAEKEIMTVCSIGNPQSFNQTVKSASLSITEEMVFMDHHDYREGDFRAIIQTCESHGAKHVVTTAKDAVKLKYFLNLLPSTIELWVLNMRLDISEGKEDIFGRINSLLNH